MFRWTSVQEILYILLDTQPLETGLDVSQKSRRYTVPPIGTPSDVSS